MYQMYLCTYVCRIGYGPCYFPEYPYSAPPPPRPYPSLHCTGITAEKIGPLAFAPHFRCFCLLVSLRVQVFIVLRL